MFHSAKENKLVTLREYVEKMPEEYRRIAEQEGAERAACDYISGMSDRYAVSLCEELLIPKFWQL